VALHCVLFVAVLVTRFAQLLKEVVFLRWEDSHHRLHQKASSSWSDTHLNRNSPISCNSFQFMGQYLYLSDQIYQDPVADCIRRRLPSAHTHNWPILFNSFQFIAQIMCQLIYCISISFWIKYCLLVCSQSFRFMHHYAATMIQDVDFVPSY
jgi:hypothetical protein